MALTRIDTNPAEDNGTECRVIMVARNEGMRLPWQLSYYRALGVTRFFVIDNGSNDNSVPFLLQQKDCHVFTTNDSYAASDFGLNWQKEILRQFGGSHWWLIIDADEMLVYPGSESVKLPEFCRFLDNLGAQGLYTMFLDMYSRGPVAEAIYKSGQPFLDICPCFDSEYSFQPRLKAPWAPTPFPAYEPIGGPRLRRFYPEYYRAGRPALMKAKVLRRLRNTLQRFGIKLTLDCSVPPILYKIPLVKSHPGLVLASSHTVAPLQLAPVTGALLHFKFFSDFHDRAARERLRGEHFDGASEYSRYDKSMQSDPRMSFYYDKTATYKDTAQLINLGLIKDDAAFKAFRLSRA